MNNMTEHRPSGAVGPQGWEWNLSRRRSLLALLFVLALVLANCARVDRNSPSSVGGSAPVGILVYGSGGQPVNLEPGNITDGNSVIVQNQIYNRLLEFKPGSTDLVPALATEWSASPDGKTWTFKLRQGVKFQDGNDFDAEAVRFNFERWWDPAAPQGFRQAGRSYEIWQQIFGGFKGDSNSLLQSMAVPDRYTIQFILKQPFAAFPSAIASGFFGIASPAAIKKAGADYGTPNAVPVGTGPFSFKEWRTGDRVVLTKNPTYWRSGLPRANQLLVRFITDPAARLAQLRAKQVDFTIDLAPDQRAEIERDPNLGLVSRPSFNVGYLALNPAYKPLADRRVRQAIAQAINKAAIVKAFWGESAVADPHFLPPALGWARATNLTDYAYNPQQAKALLAQAGYPNGFPLELWYMPVSRPYFPTPKPIAEAFAADLSAVGLQVSLKTKDWAAYINDRKKAPGYQAFMLGWTADYGDPDSFYYPHFGPGGTADLGNWQNPRLIELLNQARATREQATRTQLYTEVDTILHQEALRLPIVHSQPLLAHRKGLKGWIPSPLGAEPFEEIGPP